MLKVKYVLEPDMRCLLFSFWGTNHTGFNIVPYIRIVNWSLFIIFYIRILWVFWPLWSYTYTVDILIKNALVQGGLLCVFCAQFSNLFDFSCFVQIQCPSCQFVWCFKCHSPWHEGVNCKEYKKGDKLLRHWASEIEHGQRNAQKCPKCKVGNPLVPHTKVYELIIQTEDCTLQIFNRMYA